ncbi:MAG: aldehyde dehydrogenase family protein [Hyphomicrobiales bacterium]|nr:MAG: aldehyde dehydrogenase family protein [Hyphomicrobiales bacterium]
MSIATTFTADPDHWAKLATTLTIPSRMWIDGDSADAREGNRRAVISPRDGKPIVEVPDAGADDADRAVSVARKVFRSGVWSQLSPRERGDILIRWADLLDQHRDEMALLISLEMGKPIAHSWQIEMRTSINLIRWYGEYADKLMDESPRGRPDSVALVTREPVGVVAAITPWNFPMTLACFKIPAALVAGNSLILKPASQSPLSALRMAELGALAGLPAGVFQVVTGGAVSGQALALHNEVDCLTFTGSTAVGKQLLTCAGESNAKTVWLELGGKSANIIFPDAPDLEEAITTAAWAIWFNSGQMCTAGSRLLVQRSIHEQVVTGVVEKLRALNIGDPLDPAVEVGPLSSRHHRDSVLTEIRCGLDSGAHLVSGTPEPLDRDGYFITPAVFDDVDPDSRLAQHEIFGPVLSVIPFDDDAHALQIANNSDYGLGSAVWTSDITRVHRISRGLEAGLVWVNCFEEGDASVPFGGRKLSGHGADKSVHGIDKFTNLKTTWVQL